MAAIFLARALNSLIERLSAAPLGLGAFIGDPGIVPTARVRDAGSANITPPIANRADDFLGSQSNFSPPLRRASKTSIRTSIDFRPDLWAVYAFAGRFGFSYLSSYRPIPRFGVWIFLRNASACEVP